MDLAFFTRTPDGDLLPADLALSSWGHGHVHGVAVSGALAWAAERAVAETGRTDLRPARWTVDLIRAAKQRPSALRAEVVREGPRIAAVDVTMSQDDDVVARATLLLLRATESPGGQVWEPSERPGPPPADVVPPSTEPRVPFLHSGDVRGAGWSTDWSQDFREHQNPRRKASWNSAVPVVAGEPFTPFQAVAAIADGASLVTNWGTNGVEQINTDITLGLSRLPVSTEIGLVALDRVEHDGIAVGTATVLDRDGVLGTVVLTSLANVKRTVDFTEVAYDDDGTRHTPGA